MAKHNDKNIHMIDVGRQIERQCKEWPLLKQNIDILRTSPRDEIFMDSPVRIISKRLLKYRKGSITANLTAIINGERPCFLCRDARPTEQRYLTWNEYDILVNPYPADECHYTIVNRNHVPQNIGGRVTDMVELARMLKNECIFYNGAKCGASAPDHMHFQAITTNAIRNFIHSTDDADKILESVAGCVSVPKEGESLFGYFIIDIIGPKGLEELFSRIIETLPSQNGEEPMMNVLAFEVMDRVRLVVIPRKKHRPGIYGNEAGKMLVSPASLEMAGLFLTSREEDFTQLNSEIACEIYQEVGYSPKEFNQFISRLTK